MGLKEDLAAKVQAVQDAVTAEAASNAKFRADVTDAFNRLEQKIAAGSPDISAELAVLGAVIDQANAEKAANESADAVALVEGTNP